MTKKRQTDWVDIGELTACYLPCSKRKARKFAELYCNIKRVGNRIYVQRQQLEQLLADPDRERFPLDI